MGLTTDPNDPRLGRGVDRGAGEGMNETYLVLSEEERRQGFIRPVRQSYVHVGKEGPRYETRDLTDEERARFPNQGYVKYEEHPEDEFPSVGRYWTQEDLDSVEKGCGVETRMGLALAETYARRPDFYGATFCVGCNKHLAVGSRGEFIWDDGTRVGT